MITLVKYDEDKLPCPRFSGYRVLPQPRFRRLAVLDGAPRYRLTQPRNTYWVNLVWTMTKEQMKDFRDFYHNDISHGSNWFLIDLDIGSGKQTYEGHFVEDWTSQPNGTMHWDVAATLELRHSASYPLMPLKCDTIYAGVSDEPSQDVIDSGAPAALPTEIIDPCPNLGVGF